MNSPPGEPGLGWRVAGPRLGGPGQVVRLVPVPDPGAELAPGGNLVRYELSFFLLFSMCLFSGEEVELTYSQASQEEEHGEEQPRQLCTIAGVTPHTH